jgi:hypothetical protein
MAAASLRRGLFGTYFSLKHRKFLSSGRSAQAFCSAPQYEKPDVRKLAQLAQIHVTDDEVRASYAEMPTRRSLQHVKVFWLNLCAAYCTQRCVSAGSSLDTTAGEGHGILRTAAGHGLAGCSPNAQGPNRSTCNTEKGRRSAVCLVRRDLE